MDLAVKYLQELAKIQRAILNFTPGPQGLNLSPRGEVHPLIHPQGLTLFIV
jgi:hypothetical protein